MNVSIIEYLKAPCRACSIPYYKQKRTVIPDGMRIVHDDDYSPAEYADYIDEPYFRLYHDMKAIGAKVSEAVEIVAATPDKTDLIVDTINASYDDLTVTVEQMDGYRKTPEYDPDLWILLRSEHTGEYVGSGIADYDREIGELSLEWIQVLSRYRGRGYGKTIVDDLLAKMSGIAKFATVSVKMNDPTNPIALYRKCGFVGSDVWHILRKK